MKIDLADSTLFGNDAGEDEIPNVLASYFVDQAAFAAFFNRGNRLHIARSRKGMGKSALLSKLAYDLEGDKNSPLLIRVTGADLFGIAMPTDYNHLALQNFWKKVLCARINYEIGKSIGFAFSDQTMALVESAEIAGFRDRNVIGALLARIKSSKIPIETRVEEYANHEELLKRAMASEGDRPVWLLVDDIDATYIDTADQQALVSTFFSACRALVRDVKNLFVRATVRTDVWTNFRKNEDMDKSEQYVTDISWSARELKRILSKKVFAYLQRNYPAELKDSGLDYEEHADKVLELAFNRRMTWGNIGVKPYRPISVLAAGRPRWMSQLCRLSGQQAAKLGKDRIGINEIRTVLKIYTRYRLSDIYKEHSHQFADLEKLIETFANKKARYTTSELLKTISGGYRDAVGEEHVPDVDGFLYSTPVQLAHFLFKIGFITARRAHKDHEEFAEFVRHEERPELLMDLRNLDDGLVWEIYPSYRDALGIISMGQARRKAMRPRTTSSSTI